MKTYSPILTLCAGICLFLLTGCTRATPSPTISPSTSTPSSTPTRTPTPTWFYATITPSKTRANTPTRTPRPTDAPFLTNTPIVISTPDAQGRITWHPEEILMAFSNHGGDGGWGASVPSFLLYWDGTLLQPGEDKEGPPYISHLDNSEICKLLNTAEKSGFFGEPNSYNMPFDGTPGSALAVNSWRRNRSSAQMFFSAVDGLPYSDFFFCQNCPIPYESTIIQPGLANLFFLIREYIPAGRKYAKIEKLTIYPTDILPDEQAVPWPIDDIPFDAFVDPDNPLYCNGIVVVEGEEIQSVLALLGDNHSFIFPGLNDPVYITHSAIWPKQDVYCDSPAPTETPSVPLDYTLTCSPEDGSYNILPLRQENKFWYYSPTGKWGAEVVADAVEIPQVHVVSKFGYEHIYQYTPSKFGQQSIKVYPRFWTPDDLLFIVNVLPGEYKNDDPFFTSLGLEWIDVRKEKIGYYFIGSEGQHYDYSISPDGQWLVYIQQGDSPLRLMLQNLQTGEQESILLAGLSANGPTYNAAGSFAWSPDGMKLYFAASYDNRSKGDVLKLALANPNHINIIYSGSSEIKIRQWTLVVPTIEICTLDKGPGENCSLYINPKTDEVIEW
jgi:hypothetical protein